MLRMTRTGGYTPRRLMRAMRAFLDKLKPPADFGSAGGFIVGHSSSDDSI